jgi:hypothetical protein
MNRYPRGPRPFGTAPGESAALRTMLRMRKRGATLQAIADALNEAGHTPRRARQWTPGNVAWILERVARDDDP